MSLDNYRNTLLALMMMAIGVQGISQNLIQNPSFEVYNDCPKEHGTFAEDIPHWGSPTEGSTDYFNVCSTSMGVSNFIGDQEPQDGDAYAGFYMYAPNDYREYVQTKLAEPLKPGISYEVSFYVSLSDKSYYGVKKFGVLFAKDELKSSVRQVLTKGELVTKLYNGFHFIELFNIKKTIEQEKWVKISGEFVAKGYERYMVIGNYHKNDRTDLMETQAQGAKKASYYYIDNVHVEALTDFSLGVTHVFDNLNFETDKFEIKGPAIKELKRLHSYLKQDSRYHIAIMGHTDNVGGSDYNHELSQKRAKAVSDYLIKLGIDKGRIQWEGYGNDKPVDTNNTEIGRKTNRRVEFVITEFDDADVEEGGF
ncbi:OmpA family protein [Sediminicola luteus]|uniref:OmpA-like domain-containing protein n=1 Tax=Sediminicola luteus TaxID=319238 RepID=A0A2A4G8X2_9FLAO|nr:OmpA family protein [Sediminicola luteus]PCE64420.1 hypothetical protein B7P33_09020 [Sediminicola luteus]